MMRVPTDATLTDMIEMIRARPHLAFQFGNTIWGSSGDYVEERGDGISLALWSSCGDEDGFQEIMFCDEKNCSYQINGDDPAQVMREAIERLSEEEWTGNWEASR